MGPELITDTPFVLLDDARVDHAAPARLYRAPVEVIATRAPGEVRGALERLRAATATGLHAAGFLTYEAGHALEPKAGTPGSRSLPLLWFGLFEAVEEIAPDDVAALLPAAEGGWLGTPQPGIARADYDVALTRVLDLIRAGDIYQANLTFQTAVQTAGHPLALYAGLRARARAGYGGVVYTGEDWLLSASPELFFAADHGAIHTRPMKGTATRGATPEADKAAIDWLARDPKQRAENLMIVDLLRNDLSRVAERGTVETPELFRVETYPTVHQMTSTVRATLAPGKDAVDAIAALFPCGSITGAPKIRAMQVIGEVEAGPRGAYTGSIGRIDAGGARAAFSVAIRTLHIGQDGAATLGLGSGIVADSNAADEWEECLAKGRFVASTRRFDLIETMAFDPRDGILRLEAHLARMKASAMAMGFTFDRHATRNELQAATFRLTTPTRVRLLLAREGSVSIETRPLPALPEGEVIVALAPMPVDPRDFRLCHKTSDRDFYNTARVAGAFETMFTDPNGFLTEGSFTNIFVPDGDRLRTPPLSRGLLPGILRAELIETGRAIEGDVCVEDLMGGFFVGNALRGLLPARLQRL